MKVAPAPLQSPETAHRASAHERACARCETIASVISTIDLESADWQGQSTTTSSHWWSEKCVENRADYYHSNQQYSTNAITNSSGAIVERYAYTAYGEPTICNASGSVISNSTISNRYAYTGREWDATVALYHFRARWMSGLTGRFLGRDPIGFKGSPYNLHELAKSSPILRRDPLGLACAKECEEKDRRSEFECCKASRSAKEIDDNGNLVPFVVNIKGLTFCCDGRPVTCVYPEVFRPRHRSNMGFLIVAHCTKVHEESHRPDIAPCRNECPSLDWATFTDGKKAEVESECKARQKELDCLAGGIWLCIDTQCAQEVEDSANEIFDTRKCPRLTKPFPLGVP
jgi:RHS repeat-associated protein